MAGSPWDLVTVGNLGYLAHPCEKRKGVSAGQPPVQSATTSGSCSAWAWMYLMFSPWMPLKALADLGSLEAYHGLLTWVAAQATMRYRYASALVSIGKPLCKVKQSNQKGGQKSTENLRALYMDQNCMQQAPLSTLFLSSFLKLFSSALLSISTGSHLPSGPCQSSMKPVRPGTQVSGHQQNETKLHIPTYTYLTHLYKCVLCICVCVQREMAIEIELKMEKVERKLKRKAARMWQRSLQSQLHINM